MSGSTPTWSYQRHGPWWMGLGFTGDANTRCGADGVETRISDGLRLVASNAEDQGLKAALENRVVLAPSVSTRSLKQPAWTFQDSVPGWTDLSIYALLSGHNGRATSEFVKNVLASEIGIQLQAKEASRMGDMQDEMSNVDPLIFFDDRTVMQIFQTALAKIDEQLTREAVPAGCGCLIVAHPRIVKVVNHQLVSNWSRTFFTINLGDSIAYLLRQGNIEDLASTQPEVSAAEPNLQTMELHAVPLNQVHKPYLPEERQRIEAAGGTLENGKVNGVLHTTRSLGDVALKKYGVSCVPTFSKFTMEPFHDPFIVMATDSFFSLCTPDEALRKMRAAVDKESRRLANPDALPPVFQTKSICRQVIETVMADHVVHDNITTVLLHFIPEF